MKYENLRLKLKIFFSNSKMIYNISVFLDPFQQIHNNFEEIQKIRNLFIIKIKIKMEEIF